MKEATRRQRLDMLNGPIWNKLPQFALPVAATAILGQLFNAADVAVVGNFTGAGKTVAVAAVGANSAVIGLIINLFIGIALGCNVVIAHAIGRRDSDAVQRAVHTSVVVAVIGGIIVGLLGQLIAAPLLGLLNVPDEVFPLALLYLRIYLVGLPVILLYNFEAAIFRSVGETRVPLIALTLSGILNVVLNLFFVAVLNMSVSGVAIATVISNVVSSVILFVKLRRTELDIRLDPKKLRIDLPILRRILAIGLPAGVQSSLFSVSNIVIQSATNSLGTVVMAASSAAFNIEILTFDIIDAFSQACTTFVGQNYGAGKPGRIWQGVKASALMMIVYWAFTFVVLMLGAGTFVLLFVEASEVEILRDAELFLHISVSFFPILGLLCILRYTIQGAGYTNLAMLSGVSEMIARILISLLAVPAFGYIAVCFGDPTAWIFADLFLIPAFAYVYRHILRMNKN